MIVLDASAALELVLNTAVGRQVAARIAPPRLTLHAPHLIDLEVAQVLRRFEHRGDIDQRRARQALAVFGQLDLQRYDHFVLLPRIWALRHNLTAYDASYVALAEALGAVLLTRDERLVTATHSAQVELVAVS